MEMIKQHRVLLCDPPLNANFDDLFELLFEHELQAMIAVAQISGFAPIPCYEFTWFYHKELPVEPNRKPHKAILMCNEYFVWWMQTN